MGFVMAIKQPIEKLHEGGEKLCRKERKFIRNRKKIKESGLDIFAEKGLHEAKIEDITETADLGKGTFYSHFDSKDVLFTELFEDSVQKLTGLIKKLCANGKTKSLKDTLDGLLNAHFTFFRDYYENFILVFQGQGILNLQKEDEREILEPILQYIKVIENCLHPYKLDISSDKLRKLACAVAGFVTGYFSFVSIGLSEEEIGDIALKTSFLDALSTFLHEI
jgi:AcrR family transcriptional regulator